MIFLGPKRQPIRVDRPQSMRNPYLVVPFCVPTSSGICPVNSPWGFPKLFKINGGFSAFFCQKKLLGDIPMTSSPLFFLMAAWVPMIMWLSPEVMPLGWDGDSPTFAQGTRVAGYQATQNCIDFCGCQVPSSCTAPKRSSIYIYICCFFLLSGGY